MTDLKSLTLPEMTAFLQSLGEPAFRGRQVFTWLHRGVTDFDGMTNLSKSLREKLKEKAFITKPEIVLADEPTGNLDTKSSYEIMDIFKALNDSGKTVVMVTHEPDIAEQTKRILVMRDGQIVSDERK